MLPPKNENLIFGKGIAQSVFDVFEFWLMAGIIHHTVQNDVQYGV